MSKPVVSVIVPVHNVEDWLGECLASVHRQTHGPSHVELIVVDDCSTDSTADVVDGWSGRFPRFTSRRFAENSGSPGTPRNAALDLATGEYVFFLDADDYLGDEALERMVAVAEHASSDIVLGKVVAPPGQPNRVPASIFRRSVLRGTLFDSPAYSSLGPWKLFRRDLIERHRLRFPALPRWGDTVFTNQCYLRASTVSIVADYDCYYLRSRPDESSVSQRPVDHLARLSVAERLIDAVVDRFPPGARRDHLLRQHVRLSILPACGRSWLDAVTEDRQRDVFTRAGRLLRRCVTPNVSATLAPQWRLHAELIIADRLDDFRTVLRTFLQTHQPATD